MHGDVATSTGLFFLTELDPEVAIKGFRDPLGFQPLWSHFGHNLVGNLTTATTSARGFTTLILGHYFGQILVRDGKIGEKDLIEPFLKFEQMAAYSRVAWGEETGEAGDRILGINRVKTRYSDGNKKVPISADRDGQILSNQKTYGLWGLYSVSARNSGLLHPKNLELSESALDFVKRSIVPKIERAGIKLANQILSFLASDKSIYEPVGKDKALGKMLAGLHGPIFDDDERVFFARHLVHGHDAFSDGRQKRLWEWMEKTYSGDDWIAPFSMEDVERLIARIARSGDQIDATIREVLERIRCLEQVIAPAEQMFDLMLEAEGQNIKDVARILRAKWGKALPHIDLEKFRSFSGWIQKGAGEDGEGPTAGRLENLASAMQVADYEAAARHLQAQNEAVMSRRGAGPWVALRDDAIEVRYKDEVSGLSDAKDLPSLWSHSFFLDSLKTIGATVFMKRARP